MPRSSSKTIFFTRPNIYGSIRIIFTAAIFIAVPAGIIAVIINWTPPILNVSVPVGVFLLVFITGILIDKNRDRIRSIEIAREFLIIEYGKKGDVLIQWDNIQAISIDKDTIRMHSATGKIKIVLNDNDIEHINLHDFYHDQKKEIINTFNSICTYRLENSGNNPSPKNLVPENTDLYYIGNGRL